MDVPLYVDECTTPTLRVSFAQILVEMDVTKETPKSVKIAYPNGNIIEQKVVYDWLPHFCKKCQIIGHNFAFKTKPPKAREKPRQK